MIKERSLKRIITFHTTTDAIGFERYCMENGIPGRLIAVPGEISAGCGMCWMVPLEKAEAADRLVKEGILKTEGSYLLTM